MESILIRNWHFPYFVSHSIVIISNLSSAESLLFFLSVHFKHKQASFPANTLFYSLVTAWKRINFSPSNEDIAKFRFGKRSLKGMCQEIVRLVLTVTDINPEASIYCTVLLAVSQLSFYVHV